MLTSSLLNSCTLANPVNGRRRPGSKVPGSHSTHQLLSFGDAPVAWPGARGSSAKPCQGLRQCRRTGVEPVVRDLIQRLLGGGIQLVQLGLAGTDVEQSGQVLTLM